MYCNVHSLTFSVTILSCRKGATNCTRSVFAACYLRNLKSVKTVLAFLLFPGTHWLPVSCKPEWAPAGPELFCMLSVLGSCKVAALILECIKLSISLTHARQSALLKRCLRIVQLTSSNHATLAPAVLRCSPPPRHGHTAQWPFDLEFNNTSHQRQAQAQAGALKGEDKVLKRSVQATEITESSWTHQTFGGCVCHCWRRLAVMSPR